MPSGVPEFPRSAVEILPDWLEMAEFIVPLDDITSTFSTGEFIMEYLPENIFLVSLIWRTTAAYTATAATDSDADNVRPVLQFGDTTNYRKFGILNAQHLCDTGAHGELPLNFEDTSTGGNSLACWVDFRGENALTTGTLELFLKYRANSERSAKRGKRAK